MSEWIDSHNGGIRHQVKAVKCGTEMVMIMFNVGLLDANIAISLDAASNLSEQIDSALAELLTLKSVKEAV